MAEHTPDSDDRARDDAEVVADIVAIMRDNPICMLTTVTSEGSLAARPMTAQRVDSHGDLWLFAKAGSDLAVQIDEDPRVNLAFVGDRTWVSLAGTATVEVDEVRARDLWDGPESAWFDGPTDPSLRVVHVAADSAQLWDAPGAIGTMVAIARTLVADDQDDAGDFGDSRAVEM
ncbi:MAG TPA: pyridoxamine 5'-phosphate oxidase family protein [Nitriliruptoraceae bacterium]|nr:pyridoxamine 5'-phosphate oxidase family protein [Nitriliruptoraceae bacterium]